MRIATFNVQNLRLREGWHLDGARDRDVPEDSGSAAEALDLIDRRLTAGVIRDLDADVVALQEVFDGATLDHFHDRVLGPAGVAPYPHRICVPGNDGRGLDVALMSRLPIDQAASFAALKPEDIGLDAPPGTAGLPIFRRDCLVARIGRLTVFVCHFKAPWPDPEAAWPVRRMEAEAVRRIIEGRFADPASELWLIAGDLNDADPPGTPGRSIAPLLGDFSVDLSERMQPEDRWTFSDPATGRTSLPDALLASPALALGWPDAVPRIIREGLGREAGPGAGPRLPGVGDHRPHASDHAAMVVDFRGL